MVLQVGQGSPPEKPSRFYLTDAEQRSQFSLWSIFGSPMLISFNVGSASNATLALVGNAEVLAVDQDPLGVQGSLVNSGGDDGTPCAACETYVKPLHDGSFAVVLLNKGAVSTTAVASFGRVMAESVGNDFRPAGCVNGGHLICGFARARVRDLWESRDLGEFEGSVNISVDAHGAAMLKVTPVWTTLKTDDDQLSRHAPASSRNFWPDDDGQTPPVPKQLGLKWLDSWPLKSDDGIALSAPRGSASGTYTNPIIAGNWPDPGAIRVNGTYLVATTGDGFAIHSSRDLGRWSSAGSIFDEEQEPRW